jgi:anti-anti-sigma factor
VDDQADQLYTLLREPLEGGPDGRRIVVVRARGDLDVNARKELVDTITELLGAGYDEITLDLSRVEFLDSEAISGLIAGYTAAKDAGTELKAYGAKGIVYRALDLTGLLPILQHPAGSDRR